MPRRVVTASGLAVALVALLPVGSTAQSEVVE